MKILFEDIILQAGGTSGLLLFIPLLLCCMLPMIMRMFKQRGAGGAVGGPTETDVWFTSYPIKDAYGRIEAVTEEWRNLVSQVETKPSRFGFGRKKTPQERFAVSQTIPPRLYRVQDGFEGDVTFEFTEVENGGTSIRATYSPGAKARIQTLRANMPLKVPFGVGVPCSACGKMLLPEFSSCPYCGQKVK